MSLGTLKKVPPLPVRQGAFQMIAGVDIWQDNPAQPGRLFALLTRTLFTNVRSVFCRLGRHKKMRVQPTLNVNGFGFEIDVFLYFKRAMMATKIKMVWRDAFAMIVHGNIRQGDEKLPY